MRGPEGHTRSRRWAARVVLGGIAVFWGLVLALGAANPGYTQTRDYVSTLASRGAVHGWLGVLAICSAAVAILATAVLLRELSRIAAALSALAGAGFLVVAFTRLACANGAASCGLGGRFELSGFTEVTHSAATALAAVCLVVAMAWSGIALLRRGFMRAGRASLAASAATAVAFLATGGSSPGWIERIGIAVATAWLACVAIAALAARSD
jgi:hypothetical membrane protein